MVSVNLVSWLDRHRGKATVDDDVLAIDPAHVPLGQHHERFGDVA